MVSSEYQEYFLRGESGRCVGLTTLLPSCTDCLEIWKSQRPGTFRDCSDLRRDCCILPDFCNILPVVHPDDRTDIRHWRCEHTKEEYRLVRKRRLIPMCTASHPRKP